MSQPGDALDLIAKGERFVERHGVHMAWRILPIVQRGMPAWRGTSVHGRALALLLDGLQSSSQFVELEAPLDELYGLPRACLSDERWRDVELVRAWLLQERGLRRSGDAALDALEAAAGLSPTMQLRISIARQTLANMAGDFEAALAAGRRSLRLSVAVRGRAGAGLRAMAHMDLSYVGANGAMSHAELAAHLRALLRVARWSGNVPYLARGAVNQLWHLSVREAPLAESRAVYDDAMHHVRARRLDGLLVVALLQTTFAGALLQHAQVDEATSVARATWANLEALGFPPSVVSFVGVFEDVFSAAADATMLEIVRARSRLLHAEHKDRVLPFARFEGAYAEPEIEANQKQNATEREHARREAARLLASDSVTGLPSLAEWTRHLRMLGPARRVALAFDLDRFAAVNERHGYPLGDRVLRLVAERMVELDGVEACCRLRADTFALSMSFDGEDADDDTLIDRAAERVQRAIGKPFHVYLPGVRLTACVGAQALHGAIGDPGAVLASIERALGGAMTIGPDCVSVAADVPAGPTAREVR